MDRNLEIGSLLLLTLTDFFYGAPPDDSLITQFAADWCIGEAYGQTQISQKS